MIELITIHAMNIANCGNMKTALLQNFNAICVGKRASRPCFVIFIVLRIPLDWLFVRSHSVTSFKHHPNAFVSYIVTLVSECGLQLLTVSNSTGLYLRISVPNNNISSEVTKL